MRKNVSKPFCYFEICQTVWIFKAVISGKTKLQMRTYKLTKAWTIAIYIFAPCLIALFLFLLLLPFIPAFNDGTSNQIFWFMAPLSIGMIALSVLGLMDAVKGRFVIANDHIYSRGVFTTRTLMLDEIKGFRISDKYIFVEPLDDEKKNIKISTYFGKTEEIIEWLQACYPDLDLQNVAKEEEEILENESFGATVYQREEKLVKARRTAKTLNWAGSLIGLWAFFWPTPYNLVLSTAIAIPVVCLIVVKMHDGLIRLDEKKASAYPSVFWAFFITSLAVFLRALLDFHIFDYSNVWVLSLLIAVVFTGLLAFRNPAYSFQKGKDYLALLGIVILAGCFGFGAVITSNCLMDGPDAVQYQAQVLNKRISSGKTTTYYIELTPWGVQKEKDEVAVSKTLYYELQQEDPVNIYLKKGKLAIPWFIVTN